MSLSFRVTIAMASIVFVVIAYVGVVFYPELLAGGPQRATTLESSYLGQSAAGLGNQVGTAGAGSSASTAMHSTTNPDGAIAQQGVPIISRLNAAFAKFATVMLQVGHRYLHFFTDAATHDIDHVHAHAGAMMAGGMVAVLAAIAAGLLLASGLFLWRTLRRPPARSGGGANLLLTPPSSSPAETGGLPEVVSRIPENGSLLSAITGSSFDAILTITLDGEITSWNPAAERTFGYSAGEAIGSNAEMLIPPDHREELAEIRARVLQGRNICKWESVRIDSAGNRHDVALTVSPVMNAQGRVVGALVITRDITDDRLRDECMKDLKGKIAHASRMRAAGRMSGAIVHELGQPLTAIGGFIKSLEQLLQRQGSTVDGKVVELVERAGQQTQHARDVLVRMREFIANRTTRPEMLDINDIVEAGLRTALAGFPKANLQVVREYDRHLPKVPLDKTQVHQVVANLARNAIEAMQASRKRVLTVSTKARGDGIEVIVTDTAPDLTEEDRKQLFDPYLTTKGGGMGIGLPLSRAIVEAHGGRMKINPNAGGGNQFGFFLPHGSA